MLIHQDLTEKIIGAAIELHATLGSGLLESAYAKCLKREMELRGLRVEKEVVLPVRYKGVTAETGYRIDFIVDEKVIVELKAVEALNNVHRAQILTYLKLSGLRVGLIFNFHSPKLMCKHGFDRFVI